MSRPPLAERVRSIDVEALGIWAASRFSVWMIAGAAGWMFASQDQGVVPALDRWQRWDFHHYWGIALHGYGGQPTGVPNEAFFPGFPALLWLGNELGVRHVLAGLLVSLVAGTVAAVALGRIGELEGGRRVGRLAVLAWVTAPSAIFLAAPYTESLFLACAFPAWLAARRGHWMAAGLLTALSCTVRVSGVFLAVAIGVHWLTTRRADSTSGDGHETPPAAVNAETDHDHPAHGDHEEPGSALASAATHDHDMASDHEHSVQPRVRARAQRTWTGFGWLLLPAVPLVAWSFYLRQRTGDWLAWLHAQSEGWNREFTSPWGAFEQTWNAAFGGTQIPGFAWMFRAEIVAMIVGVVLTVALIRWRRWGEATWVGLQVIAFGTSTWYFSVPRSTLLWWPLWVAIAMLATRHRWVLWAYLALSAPLMAVWAAAFLTGRWAG